MNQPSRANEIAIRSGLRDAAESANNEARFNAWRNAAFNTLGAAVPALQQERETILIPNVIQPMHLPGDVEVSRNLKGQLVQRLRNLDDFMPGGSKMNEENYNPAVLLEQIFRVEAFAQENIARVADIDTNLRLRSVYTYLGQIKALCNVRGIPYSGNMPRLAAPHPSDEAARAVHTDVAIMARTGLAVAAGIGALTTGALAAFGGGSGFVAMGYAAAAMGLVYGKKIFEQPWQREVKFLADVQSGYPDLQKRYNIQGPGWARITAELPKSQFIKDYLGFSREKGKYRRELEKNPQYHEELRKNLIDEMGGAGYLQSQHAEKFIDMTELKNIGDLGNFYDLLSRAKSDSTKEFIQMYVQEGVTADKARKMGVRI